MLKRNPVYIPSGSGERQPEAEQRIDAEREASRETERREAHENPLTPRRQTAA
jgi:hypothetical protein